jgi:hypothetical protein
MECHPKGAGLGSVLTGDLAGWDIAISGGYSLPEAPIGAKNTLYAAT